MAAPPLVAQPQPNSSEPDSNVDKPNSNVSEPEWSPWTPAGDRCMRRRPRVPGLNNRWGEWLWYPHWNQYIRFNPVVNGTDVESFEEEFQFRLIDGNPVSVTSPDPHTEQTGHTEPPNIKSEENAVRTKDQGSTIIDESDDLIMFDPEDVGQQGVDIERSGMKTERDEGSSKGSAATPSMHSNITRHQEFIGEQHRASSAITSVKPALTTSPSSVPVASVVSTSGRAVAILSSAADISTAVATWGFGAVMGGLSYANMRAARKTAEASMRSARAAERSAAAAENSAQAGMRSALATEESLTLMQKEFEATNQDNGGRSPSPDNGGSGAGLVEARSLDQGISHEQQRMRSVPAATSSSLGTGLTSSPGCRPPQEVPRARPQKRVDPAQTPEVVLNPVTSKTRVVPVFPTPPTATPTLSARSPTASISRPQAPSSAIAEPPANQDPPKQVSNARTDVATPVKKAQELRRKERERERELENRLRNPSEPD